MFCLQLTLLTYLNIYLQNRIYLKYNWVDISLLLQCMYIENIYSICDSSLTLIFTDEYNNIIKEYLDTQYIDIQKYSNII